MPLKQVRLIHKPEGKTQQTVTVVGISKRCCRSVMFRAARPTFTVTEREKGDRKREAGLLAADVAQTATAGDAFWGSSIRCQSGSFAVVSVFTHKWLQAK